jgi:hypothetical protein
MHETKLDSDLVDISLYNKFRLELFFVFEGENLPPSLFFDAFLFGIPTNGTSHGESEPTARRLQQTCGELRYHYLGPWQILPWRYRAKPLGVGRQRLILFRCCIVCCVCVQCFLPVNFGGEITVELTHHARYNW